MNDWVPVPGSARARLLDAALVAFERDGFDGAGVVEIAQAAGVTTGSLYHHFESKPGLFKVVRREMERRVRDRMEGAFAAAGGGRDGVNAAMLVGFDAAFKLKAARILSDGPVGMEERTLEVSLEELVSPGPRHAAQVLLGAWRAALRAAVAEGRETGNAEEGGAALAHLRAGLEWVIMPPG